MLLVLLLLLVHSVLSSELVRIVQEYSGQERESNRWIKITVPEDSQNILHIDWCSSPIPNPNARQLNDCQGSGLMHKHNINYQHDPDNSRVLYIDPKEVGGWNSDHPSCLVVSANLKRQRSLMQFIYFNVKVASSPSPSVSSSSSPPTTLEEETTSSSETLVTSSSATATSTPEPYPDPGRPWRTALFIISVGGMGISCMAIVMNMEKRRNAATIQEEEEVENPSSVLTELGTGASPLFYENQNI